MSAPPLDRIIRDFRDHLRQTWVGIELARTAGASFGPAQWEALAIDLWVEWRSRLPEDSPPPPSHRPPLWNEAEARAATDTLIRALNALQPAPPTTTTAASPRMPPAAAEEMSAGGAIRPLLTGAASPLGDLPQQRVRRGRREEERLRRVLKVQAGERERSPRGHTMLSATVNGIMWPLPSDLDADPIATLRGDCAAALHALDKPEPLNVLGGVPAYRAVVRPLPVLAEAVARLCGRPAPTYPMDTQDDEAARRCVETVLDWCEGQAPPRADARAAFPDDPAGRMRAAIARERRGQQTMGGPYLQDSFNWQAGVDRLWKRWDGLFPDLVQPDRPVCTNYAEASDAAVALLRAPQSVKPLAVVEATAQAAHAGGGALPPTAPVASDQPIPDREERLRLAPLVAQIIGESRQGFQPAATPLPHDARGDSPPAGRIAELIRLLHASVGAVRPAMMRARFTAVETADLTHQLVDAAGRLLLDGPSRAARALTEDFTEYEIRAISIANRLDDVLNTADAAPGAGADRPAKAVSSAAAAEGTLAAMPAAVPLPASAESAPDIDLEAQALALLFKHPDWSILQITQYLKVDRRTPYKWGKFRKAAEADGRLRPRGRKDGTPRRGRKTRDGRVEAYVDRDEDE